MSNFLVLFNFTEKKRREYFNGTPYEKKAVTKLYEPCVTCLNIQEVIYIENGNKETVTYFSVNSEK